MKCNYTVFIFIGIIVMNTQGLAQLKSTTKMVIFDGAYAFTQGDETGHLIDGYSIGASFEKRYMIGSWSGGVSLSYIKFQDHNDKTQREIDFSSVPLTLYGKILFGPSKFSGYFKGGFGFHFSSVSQSGKDIDTEDRKLGITLIIGIGTHIYLSNKLFINVAYNQMFLDNSSYRVDMLALIKLGIGFQYN